MSKRLLSLEGKLAALLVVVFSAGLLLPVPIGHLVGDGVRALLIAFAIGLPLLVWMARRATRPATRLLRALQGAVASYRDGDFSVSLGDTRRDEIGELVAVHNELGRTLREQRQHVVQRELLVDTMVQHTPVALVLVDSTGHVAYANIAARRLFNDGMSLGGLGFDALLSRVPDAAREAALAGVDGLFTVALDGTDETFHVSRRGFRLQGRAHRLYLFRRMTRELSRQEVATWKKVIRVISHELNNSLAPISSMAHSGAEIARRGELERLPQVFAAISERARHLHRFIDGYARFAKLPAPRLERQAWPTFLDMLAKQVQFKREAALPEEMAWFDSAQLEQVLINVIKNAHESGSVADAVELSVKCVHDEVRIEVADRGCGMSEAVLANALLPFYSTKRSGTGLGLALAREIVEAHGGRIELSNRNGGGLRVLLTLPAIARGT